MRIRYRIARGAERSELAVSLPSSRHEVLERAAGWNPFVGKSLLGHMVDVSVETRVEVTEHDGEAEPLDLEAMIVNRRLAPTDLVDPGDGWWIEARQHQLLAEACEFIEEQDRSRRRRRWAIAIAVAVIGVAVAWLVEALF